MLRYTVLLRKNKDVPGYSVIAPELPGCFSQGQNLEEALANAREAIECHLEGMVKDGEELPVEQDPFIIASVLVASPKIRQPRPLGGERIIRGHPISRERVRRAVQRGIEEGRVPALGGLLKYYIEVNGRKVPVKWAIRQATGLSRFVSTEAQRVLSGIGFTVKKLGG